MLLAPQLVLSQSDDPAQPLSALLPSLSRQEVDRLGAEGELSDTYGREVSVRLAPAFADRIRESCDEIDPTIGVELLLHFDNMPSARELSPELYTILQSFGTMEGVRYYSVSRGRERTLFVESYVIRDPDSRTPLPDPVPAAVPPRERLYVYQQDASFGRNVYQVDYRVDQQAEGSAILITMTNLTRMYFHGIIPAVAPLALRLHLAIIPSGEGVIFYGNSAARPSAVLGMEERVQESFHHRLGALAVWLEDQLLSRAD